MEDLDKIGADIRNKLTPIKNLLAMLEANDPKLNELILKEIENCKTSVNYLTNLL